MNRRALRNGQPCENTASSSLRPISGAKLPWAIDRGASKAAGGNGRGGRLPPIAQLTLASPVYPLDGAMGIL